MRTSESPGATPQLIETTEPTRIGDNLTARLAALAEAATLAQDVVGHPEAAGILDELDRLQGSLARPDATLAVAIAGPTGTGRSSLLSALAGQPVARTSLVRPTTTAPTAYAIGTAAMASAAAWTDLPVKAVPVEDDGAVGGLLLIDLPAVDAAPVGASRLERDPPGGLAGTLHELPPDLVLWVTDPEKYADSLPVEHHLLPLLRSSVPVLVVVTKADTVSETAGPRIAAHLSRLIDRLLGSAEVGPVMVPQLVSARTGAGVAALRQIVEQHRAERRRPIPGVGFQLASAARRLRPEPLPVHELIPTQPLHEMLAEQVGVPGIAADLAALHADVVGRATAWPLLRGRTRRPGQPDSSGSSEVVGAASITPVLRTYAEALVDGRDGPWARALVARITGGSGEVATALTHAVHQEREMGGVRPMWSTRISRLQDVLLAGLVVTLGLVVWGLWPGDPGPVLGTVRFEAPPLVTTSALAAVFLLTGLVVHIVGRGLAQQAARQQEAAVTDALLTAVAHHTDQTLDQATAELMGARRQVQSLLERAAGTGTPFA